MYRDLLGYMLFIGTKEELLKEILSKDRVNIISGNPEVLYNGLIDEKLRKSFLEEDALIIPDGVGSLLLSGVSIKEKIAGIEVMDMLLEYAEKSRLKVYLLGAKYESLFKCKKNIEKKFRGINIAGINDGFFDIKNCENIINKINYSKADIIFVAMGSPRQEFFIETYKDKLCCKILMGVGGSFDVISGNIKRAPNFMINIGMEWLYRFFKEPWRIKKLLVIFKFLYISSRDKVRKI